MQKTKNHLSLEPARMLTCPRASANIWMRTFFYEPLLFNTFSFFSVIEILASVENKEILKLGQKLFQS